MIVGTLGSETGVGLGVAAISTYEFGQGSGQLSSALLQFGAACYREVLQDVGFVLVGETSDEGNNHYYSVRKP